MKLTALLFLLPVLLLSGCEKPTLNPSTTKGGAKYIQVNENKGFRYYVVEIEGNEYFVTYYDRSLSMCPKLPSKAKKDTAAAQ